MNIPEVRVQQVQLECRTVDGRRVIEGRAVPFDQLANIGGRFYEQHRAGSFSKTIGEGAARLPLMAAHRYDTLPVGVSTKWVETDDGLYGTWELNRSDHAEQVGEMLDDGSLRGLSIGFKSILSEVDYDSADLPVITRTENALREVSLVAVPTWDDAEVLVRSATRLRRPTPRADAARAWLDTLQSR